jgi:hypothetical protein
VRELWARIADFGAKSKRARKAWAKLAHEQSAINAMQELRTYVQFFELDGAEFQVPADNLLEAAEVRMAEFREQRKAEIEAEEQARAEAMRLKRIEAQETISKWLAGENVRVPYLDGLAFLRVSGHTVQTSQGAEVPLHHVQRALPLVLGAIYTGRAYTPKSEVRLGNYTLREIREDGTVIVGCHYFSRQEIERFAAVIR